MPHRHPYSALPSSHPGVPWSKVKVAQSCPTLCNPMDYIVHGILQARILEWVAFPFFRRSSQPRGTLVYCKAPLISWLCRCLWTELTQPATPQLLLCLPLFLFWIHLEWGQEAKVLLEMTFSAMAERHGYACMLCLGTAWHPGRACGCPFQGSNYGLPL